MASVKAQGNRGSKASKAGINDEKVAAMASCDRSGNKDFKVVATGRIGKKDIDGALDGKSAKVTVLSNDSHRSYTAFAKDKDLVHKKSNAPKGQRAKGRR